MKIEEIKNEMMDYRDFYGGILLDASQIKPAKRKKELAVIIDAHYDHIEAMANDSQHSL